MNHTSFNTVSLNCLHIDLLRKLQCYYLVKNIIELMNLSFFSTD